MSQDNLTALLLKPKDLQLVQTKIPEIADDEVLLRMDCVGICGSDVHYWQTGACGHFVLKEPMVMGHEASGVVAKIGSKVKNLKPGDRVAIEPGVPCRVCEFCKTGRYHLCPDIAFCATPPFHGNLVRYYKHAADFCYKLPDHVSMEEGALLEPLSVGIHACRRGGVTAGASVLVLGAGPIGLVTLLAARAMGASNILITDILQSRLDFAAKLGANHTLLVTRDLSEADLVRKVHELMGTHPDISIDASGAQATVRGALLATKSGGVAVLVGMGSPELTVPLAGAVAREVDIRGIFRYVNEYPIALSMVSSGLIDVKPLVTHHFSMEETLQAYETARRGDGIKVMIHVQPRDANNVKKF
ncbi:unnamed protein product [Plutella xylostella]|uniref:Sorbitol dehydrogenase n=1 Tax=Plutella xylostella TaxID=51655 RepID=A0A8S4FNG1_PLUXY|nr:sorbitol dehydrogenase [Plutella xylostella]CAG9130047.1 unnamed protein product [Plutella xylostella]